ncbi:flavin reductase family protein [Rhodococcus sp. NPDC055024]
MTIDIFDSASLRGAFSQIPSSVVAVCGHDGRAPIGMVVSTFVPVSLNPPLVSISVQNTSSTWPRLAALSQIGISVLSSEHREVARALASKDMDRFTGIETEVHGNGALFISGCGLRLDVSVEREVEAGDHAVVLLRVDKIIDVGGPTAKPIIFHGSKFRNLA